jgi:23S rRNA pseudouridine1911/1915/1917 synthase
MSTLMHQLTVTPLDEGRVRLDLYLSRELQGMSRSKIQEMIEQGLVKVNGQDVSAKFLVKEGDQILYEEMVRGPSLLEPIPMALTILYEDDHVIVLNKPAGIAVHPGAGETGATLVHGLLYHCQVNSQNLGRGPSEDDGEDQHEPMRPGIVHRLDKDTTGVMVIAKTDAAHAHLSKQFHDKTNFRQYVALLNGPFPEGDWVRDSYLYRDPRDRTKFASMDISKYEHKKEREGGEDLQGFRFARTVFKREAQYRGVLSLVSLKLFTGRTHQIRIHARDLGSSVVGDQTYGKSLVCVGRGLFNQDVEAQLKIVQRQMLHAWILGFHHPDSGDWMHFEAPLPPDFAQLVDSLEPYRD